jgi:ribonuclease T
MSINLDSTHAYISVDVEAAGSNPSQYALLSIGACTLSEPRQTFYIALEVCNLSLEKLAVEGVEPAVAMQQFATWLKTCVPQGQHPLFVAFNAPFDWMFVNDYFRRYLGYNPFGYSALDIKSYFMGLDGVTWDQTSMRNVSQRYLEGHRLSHHALQDALDQAEIFEKMLAESAIK